MSIGKMKLKLGKKSDKIQEAQAVWAAIVSMKNHPDKRNIDQTRNRAETTSVIQNLRILFLVSKLPNLGRYCYWKFEYFKKYLKIPSGAGFDKILRNIPAERRSLFPIKKERVPYQYFYNGVDTDP